MERGSKAPMKHVALITIVAAAALTGSASKPIVQPANHATSKSTLTILYTASAQGQIRSCNCTKFRFGGYGREATLVKSIREKAENVILIEGGDALEWTGFQSDLKAEVTARALKLIGYDAMVPGEDEVGKPGKRYVELLEHGPVRIVCANFRKDGGDKPTYSPYVIVTTKGKLKVGIIGLLSPSVGRAFQQTEFASSVGDPQESLNAVLGEVRKKTDFVVVVYHGPLDEAKKLKAEGAGLLLATHRTTREVLFPDKNSDTNEVTAPIEKRASAFLANAETSTNWSLGRIDLELDSVRQVKSAAHKLFYLDRRYDEDPEMVKIYDEYNTKVKDAVLTASAKFKSDAEEMLKKRGLNLEQIRARLRKSPFVTADKCKECHKEIYEIWSNSRHAKAMETLKKTKQEFDPECVSCHATGVMVRNGFTNMRDTPELANVQCEACHGPAEKHIASPAKGFGKADEHTCRSCHTDERNPDFDYAQEWAKIMH